MFQPIGKSMSYQDANIFHGREVEDLIPGTVVEFLTNGSQDIFHVGEIHDHSGNGVGFNDEFEFIGVSVESPAFRVIREEMSAIDKFGDTETHERTPVVIIAEWDC